MKKLLVIIVICALTGLISSNLMAAEATSNDGVWVSVTVSGDDIEYECYGVINKVDFINLTEGEFKKTMLQLNKVYWHDAKRNCTIKVEETKSKDGKDLGYTSTIYFKTKAILCIIPLKAEFVKKLLQTETKTEK